MCHPDRSAAMPQAFTNMNMNRLEHASLRIAAISDPLLLPTRQG
jgi:hypothetical protein